MSILKILRILRILFARKKKKQVAGLLKKTQCDDPKLSDWDGWLELELKCQLQDPEG